MSEYESKTIRMHTTTVTVDNSMIECLSVDTIIIFITSILCTINSVTIKDHAYYHIMVMYMYEYKKLCINIII